MKNIKFPILAVTIFLLVYQISPYLGAKPNLIAILFALSPFIVVWMVVKILRKGEYNGKELNGEWGYDDYEPYEEQL